MLVNQENSAQATNVESFDTVDIIELQQAATEGVL